MGEATGLERARLTIRGVRAELVVEDGRITLTKDGPPATSLSLTVDQVRGTVLEPGSRGGRGWIHLAVVGGTLAPPGELAAMSDPYTIPLTSRSAVTARRLARIVEKHLHERGLPSEPAFAASGLERGRYSSGVTLTRAPDGLAPVVNLRTADGASSRGGSTPAGVHGAVVDEGSSERVAPIERPNSPERATPSEPAVPAEHVVEPVPPVERVVPADREAVTEPTDSPWSSTGVMNRDDQGDDQGDLHTVATEAATEQRSQTALDAPGRWVKPNGPSGRTVSSPDEGPVAPVPSSAPTEPPPRALPPLAPPPLGPPPLGPPPLDPATRARVPGRELAAELRQLGELHDSGVLTDAEFEQAKARVLS